jgi:dipeptidyl aminopeptidase/acylaminoacyl peptidase
MKKLFNLSLIICLVFTIQAQEKERLSLDHYQDFEYTSNPQISPDGMQVLYTRIWINLKDDRRESDLWIVNTDGSKNRYFLKGSNGKWSPDGSRIAYTKQGKPDGVEIFVKYLGLEGEPTQITNLPKNPSGMIWSPDGQYIAFTMHVESDGPISLKIPKPPKGAKWTKAPKVVNKVDYRQDRVGFLEDGYRHIFIVPAEGGTARQITNGDWDHGNQISWTPDSKKIVFSSLRKEEGEYDIALGQSNLYIVNIETGKIDELTSQKGFEVGAKVSPDGKKIAFIGSIHTDHFYKKREAFIMNIDGSGLKSLTASLDRSPSGLVWAKDNSKVFFNINDQGSRNLYSVDMKGKLKQLTKGEHVFSMSDISKSGTVVGTLTSSQSPRDIALFNVSGSKSIKQITNVNKDILDFIELGELEEIRYKSSDGLEIQGWIVKPPNFDPSKKYPLVLRIHGGPHAMYNVGFSFNFQLHAAQDQVVLYTNPRGSTGYGYDFADAIQNAYPGKDYDDLMAGVDAVIAKGYIDKNKMYVYGGSGGGVLTSWIVGHTDRFAAASVNYPVTNWLSFVGTTDGIYWYQNFAKKPWEDPSEYIKRSPLMYVHNVKTPTMLMCGVKDLRTPISQTEEFYQALKVNKVPTVMIRFNDEFHGTGSKPSNYLRTFGYLNAWFKKYNSKETKEE